MASGPMKNGQWTDEKWPVARRNGQWPDEKWPVALRKKMASGPKKNHRSCYWPEACVEKKNLTFYEFEPDISKNEGEDRFLVHPSRKISRTEIITN